MMMGDKVIIEPLPVGGPDAGERRLFSPKGEMAQILNRSHKSFRHLVYWELDSPATGQERGHHYHRRKTENYYVISGELDLLLEDLETGVKQVVSLPAGCRLHIKPGVAHAFRSRVYSQVLEYSPEPYDPADTVPHQVKI
jgi:dTDP-4-dehydrorhamnose 3,5-epimerase-like enzyme